VHAPEELLEPPIEHAETVHPPVDEPHESPPERDTAADPLAVDPSLVGIPAVEPPVADVPAIELSAIDPPAVDPPAVDLPAVDLPAVEVPVTSSLPLTPPATVPAASAQRAASTPLQPPPPLPTELGGPGKARRRRRGGVSLLARVAAVIALLAVAAAVVLLVHSLTKSKGQPAVAPLQVVKVLIPEGKTRAQIAEIADASHLAGSYLDASKSSPLLEPSQFGAPHGITSLEGFLFPATYDMVAGEPVDRLVQEQLIAFREHFTRHDIARAKSLHVTPYQLLTIASMVEREAQIPSDRPKIAAVIYNRLRLGMPLGIDAAIYYAVEQQDHISTYTKELTEAQLHIDSPYNTRTHVGLPPTPISNPGVASIEAAAHPANAAYLYYVAGADGCGEQVFSNTSAEFEANVASYQAAEQHNGGHPPTCKHR